uniref:Uncharacterized protein n=1 Tax=viral metagenome TaxID=1070528 RepID=A0A6C0IFG8_9ZZZZ
MTNIKKSNTTKMTRKTIGNISKGGNINNQLGLDKILSIGYEVESTNLIKLTETQEYLPDNVLYNSDSARKDMEEFKKLKNYEDDEYNDTLETASDVSSIDADIEERMEEQPTAKMYNFDQENKEDPGTIYPNAVFHITNDIAKPKFNRTLKALCKDIEREGRFPTDIKDTLYKYKENKDNKEHKIHFKFKETTPQECSNFTNVEWVITYYNPPQSNNIIIETFLNMIKNIVHHLESFTPIPGQFIYTNPTTNQEREVPGSMLYKSTQEENETLYYLQTDQVESLDNICSKIQMTFSAKAEDIIDVMLKITTDYTSFSQDIPEAAAYLEENKNTIQKIQQCVDRLYDYFTVSNILTKDEKIKLRNKKNQIKQLKTYMFLILFKLNRFYYFMFYNDLVKIGKKRRYNYLKDLLFFNSRHTNYVLYKEIKEKIKELLELQVEAQVEAQAEAEENTDTKVIQIIKNLFLQSDILTEYLIEEEFKTDEYKDLIDTTTIFSKDTTVDKQNDVYGDPTFSLNSYFDFFEDPADNEKNKKIDKETIKYYDWLEYAEHDIFSANMDLKDDIVLLECRFFQDLLTSYFYHIGDGTLKEQMTNGACNKIAGKEGNPNIMAFSIANFKSIIQIPETKFLQGGTKRTKKTKKRKPNKTKITKNHRKNHRKTHKNPIKKYRNTKTKK